MIRLDGVGANGSDIEAFDYVYELTLAKNWPETKCPRTCLVGSVMRAKDHGNAKAGMTASVIAVQRDFLEPRDITRDDGGNLILDNGAGEDFLFMYRCMIKMVHDDCARQSLTPPESWKQLPPPDIAQIVYSPVKSSAAPSKMTTSKPRCIRHHLED